MKRTRTHFVVGMYLLSAVLGVMSLPAAASSYLPLGSGVDHVYAGIPFEIWGARLSAYNSDKFKPEDSRDLSSCGTAKALHIIQYCACADNVPDGVTAGHITVYYQDGSTSSVDLIVGVNTAEWSYDHPDFWECPLHPGQQCLRHTRVEPAFTYHNEGWRYSGHNFYVSIALEAKPLASVTLTVDPASYTNQQSYGHAPADWFTVGINALTLEDPLIPASANLDPDTLNLKSKGKWITAYLSLPEGFAVADIDPDSILLNGQIPAAWSQVEEETQMLMIKFDRAAVAEIVEVGEVQIAVTGIVAGDTKFEGVDTIRVINPGAGKK